jgi:hypothetical protein
MDYREECARVESEWAASRTAGNGLLVVSGDDLAQLHFPKPQHGDTWGPWRFNARDLTLEFAHRGRPDYYYVDLEDLTSSTGILDKIGHLCTKVWASPDVIGQFVAALWDLSGGYCEWARDLDMAKVIRQRF